MPMEAFRPWDIKSRNFMKTIKTCLLAAVLLATLPPLHGVQAADTPAVPLWQPHDFSFTTTTQPAIPRRLFSP